MKRYILLILFALISQAQVLGQESHRLFKNVQTRKSLQTIVSKYDSAVFLNDYSVWHDDLKISGFAFNKKSVYVVSYRIDTTYWMVDSFFVQPIQEVKIKKDSVLNAVKKLPFEVINNMHLDSLNLSRNPYCKPPPSKPGVIENLPIKGFVTDAEIWIYYFLKKDSLIYKWAYAPGLKQKDFKTLQREQFIQFTHNFMALKTVLDLK